MNTVAPRLLLVLPILFALNAPAATHYVNVNGSNPTSPYTSWSTAATNIQDAIDVAAGGDLVLVTNGVYQTGGRTVGSSLLTNRLAVTKPITVESVNGPEMTVVLGYQVPGTTNGNSAVRCAYLTNGALLVGFTLTGGATRTNGDVLLNQTAGGVWAVSTGASISNCIITGNAAAYAAGGVYSAKLTGCILSSNAVFGGRGWGGGAWNSILTQCKLAYNAAVTYGGGAYVCTLSRCELTFNSARWSGGGAYAGTANNSLILGNSVQAGSGGGSFNTILTNCTVVGNSASVTGGGCYSAVGAMQNCIIYYNTASTSPNLAAKYNYCCTTPNVFNDVDSLTNAPLFVDLANGDFRLQSNSPCINAGANDYSNGSTDLSGNPRIAGGTVDIGASEFQLPASLISHAWLQRYHLPTDGSADFSDSDDDGMNNWAEWRADTVPTNALSLLKIVNATISPTGAEVTWQSVKTRSYFLDRATNLGMASPFQTIATNIVGLTEAETYTDTTATNGGPYLYRVGVQ